VLRKPPLLSLPPSSENSPSPSSSK
jgi:hypothetical protein